MKYPNRIAELRNGSKLTQNEAADAMGMSLGGYRKLEYGERRLKLEQIEAAAKAFTVTPADVVTSEPGISPPDAADKAEAQLRSALLAFGVEAKALNRAIRSIRAGFVKDEELPERSLPRGQSSPSNRPHELEPSQPRPRR